MIAETVREPEPGCTTCGDATELVVCPPSCDGSHVQDASWPCPDCCPDSLGGPD